LGNTTKNIIEFTLIYNQHKKKLYNYAFKMLNDKMLCEDVIQNVFTKFFENLDRLKNIERVEVWLFTTARNEIYSIYRTKRTHVDQFKVEDADEIEINSNFKLEEELELREMKQMIMTELDKMTSDQSEVFLLKEYGGLSYKEIAEVMNIEIELVKSRLFKVRKKLIDKLSKIVDA
jgi:RNA polymerase sigma factor (sigma-70 family)